MNLPPITDRIEMFLTALADRCKTCVTRGRCEMCFSLDARRLLSDWKLWRVQQAANSVRTSGLTQAEESILVQLSSEREVRGDKLCLPYRVTIQEKKGILRRLVGRGLIEVTTRTQPDGRHRSYYSLPCQH